MYTYFILIFIHCRLRDLSLFAFVAHTKKRILNLKVTDMWHIILCNIVSHFHIPKYYDLIITCKAL